MNQQYDDNKLWDKIRIDIIEYQTNIKPFLEIFDVTTGKVHL